VSRDWTIDTNVLYQVADANWDAIILLSNIRQNGEFITHDYGGHIETEYWNCISKTNNELVKKWFIYITNKKRIVWFDGKLSNKHDKKFNELKFDRSDRPFVAVCFRSHSKKLVSEDSDYRECNITPPIKDYLKSEMDIDVLTIREALETD
jgi:hypothetical protein